MSVLQNQDGWWGEGNDMFFIDGATAASIAGTGTEDYFLGAWDFGAAFGCYGVTLSTGCRLWGCCSLFEDRASSSRGMFIDDRSI
jgi:hypothetical protein